MKKGDILRFPLLPPFEPFENSAIEEMLKVSKRNKIPIEKLRYKRDIFYFKAKGIKDEGWTDSVYIEYTKI